MRTWPTILALLALAGAVAPAGAGECAYEAQVCLDHLARMRDRGYAGVDLDSGAGESGWVVRKVYAGTPAAAAGIQIGDVLVSIGGIRLGDQQEMQKLDSLMKPGEIVRFTVSRDGVERTFEVRLMRMPDDVFARFVGEHMLLHATVAEAPND
jgi:predicted metalloprotease with PDZ domain